MNRKMKRRIPLIAASAMGLGGLGMGAALLAPGTAFASTTTYQATLNPLNNAQGASGTLTLALNGSQATISEQVSGLAATFNGKPYPHVQHIHIGAQGVCPPSSADTNHDGVISTTEGAPFYGGIGTSLTLTGDTSPSAGTNLATMPSGGSFTYNRTITLDSATLSSLEAGKAVIVVHGLDPSTLSAQAQSEPSDIVPSLPLAATSPALCGTLVAQQLSAVPTGGASTGGGSTSNVQDLALFAAGGALILGGGSLLAARKIRGSGAQS